MITIVLVATEWTPTFENLRRSLHQFGYNYNVLGWGLKWEGWKWRSKLYLKFLETQRSSDVFVFMDAYDTLATKTPKEALEAYIAFQKPLIVGAEWYCGNSKNCGKVDAWWERQKIKPPRKKHANAGFLMGNAAILENLYGWIVNYSPYEDDQLSLAAWINNFGDATTALDTGSALVCNQHMVDGFGQIKTSCFHHFPGPMLKLGLFPQYNYACKKILGINGRLQYPPFFLEAVFYILFALSMCFIVFFKISTPPPALKIKKKL